MKNLRELQAPSEEPAQLRLGVAKLTQMAFGGADLAPLWNSLLETAGRDPSNTAAVMDLSVIAQLLANQKTGLDLQAEALKSKRLYRIPCAAPAPALRVLALAAATDIGGNTPVEFLLDGSDVELYTLYIVPGTPLPNLLPDHDAALVIAPGSQSTRAALAEIARLVEHWPRPVLNRPQQIAELDRHRLHRLLNAVPGLCMPWTERVSRDDLVRAGLGHPAGDVLNRAAYPLIIRPIDSHAGRGLAKLDGAASIDAYLAEWPDAEFFLSPYVDYRSADGLFRKYRIVFVGGSPFACHMAISDQWKIWYLNAEMAENPGKRAEEEHFMARFDAEFVARHRAALSEMARRVGLEYFAIDCAETPEGALLLFEADNAMIVHNMDPAAIFPYKPPQMKKIFDAFCAMLKASAKRGTTATT